MKKIILIFIFSFMIIFAANAEEAKKIEIFKDSSLSLILSQSFDSESLAHNDRLELVKAGGDSIELFASEGREIEKVYLPDLDGDSENEFLVQMDLGGSGGYKEFALLKKAGNSYKMIWEASGYAGAKTSIIKDKKAGRARISIKYLDDNFEPPKPAIAIFGWLDNELKKIR